MGMKFANNAATTLAASVAPGDLTLTINSTKASTFPALGAGDYFYLTLQGLGAFGNIEVVKVTAVAGNTFTVTRGQDGTAAQAFTIGDRAELRMCSAILNELPTSATLAASSGSSLVGDGTTTVADRLSAINLASYTALRAYTGASQSAYITGYLVSANPSGTAGLFTRDDSDTTSADNGGTIIVASNGKRWKRVFSGRPNVQWFGADRVGANDSTPAIQATIAAHGMAHAPKGTYLIAGTLTGSTLLKLSGDGYDQTVFQKKAATTGHILDIIGTTQKYEVEIEGITFDVNGVDSAIVAEYVTDFYVRRCKFINMHLWGVQVGVQLGSDSVIRNTRVFVNDCVFSGSSSTYEQVLLFNSQDAYVNDCRFESGASAIGVGLYQNLDRVAVNGCYFSINKGLYYSLSTNNIRISGSNFLSCDSGIKGANQSDNGVFGATVVRNLTVDRCQFRGNTAGLQLGAVYGAQVISCVFDTNAQQAVNVNGGNAPVSHQSKDLKFVGCEFRSNNTSAVGGVVAAAVAFTGIGGAMSAQFEACQFWDDQGTPTQLRPIGFSGAFTWTDVLVAGCRLAAYSGAQSIDSDGGATLSAVYALDCQDLTATLAAGVSVRDLATTWYRTATGQIQFKTASDTVAKITAGAGNAAILDLERSGAPAGGRIAYDGNTEFYTGGVARLRIDSGGNVKPSADNASALGTGTNRWTQLFAATATISTSDARSKQQIRPLADAERAVALACKGMLCAFRFNDAVQDKGEGARWHFGVIAQEVGDAFRAQGLDPSAYGLFCHDEWPANGEQPAGDRYGVRYEELLAFMLAAL